MPNTCAFSERKFFSKRKKIIDAIYQIQEEEHVSITEAVNRLEERRGTWSLDRLWKELNNQRGRTTG